MKIALIIKDLRHGGAQRAISRLSHILHNRGHEVYMLVFDNCVEYDYSGELIGIDNKKRKTKIGKVINVISRTNKLKKIKKEYKFDIAVSYLDTPNLANILSRQNEKVYVSVRNFKSQEDSGILRKPKGFFIKHYYGKADGIIAVSELIAQDLCNTYGLPEEKVSVIYNSYDIEEIRNEKEADALSDEEKSFYESSHIAISVGRMSLQKGFGNLIKAFSILRSSHSDAKLVLIGDGDQAEALHRLAADLKIEDSVRFLGYRKNPFAYMKDADVYVLSSLFEGFPNALVEAMACGLPVVSTDCHSGPREILYENGDIRLDATEIEMADYGVLTPCFTDDGLVGSADEIGEKHRKLALAMERVMYNLEINATYREKSSQRADYFTYDKCGKKHEELFGYQSTDLT